MPEQNCIHDETQHAQLLRRLAQGADTSQRALAKGYIKAVNFKNSDNKRAYLYQITPAGIAAKSRITVQFLARKQAEYDRLAQEIAELQGEIAQTQKPSPAAAKQS